MANPVDRGFADDDTVLTAYLDGELANDERTAIEKRLTAEPLLKVRLDQLGRGGRAFGPAFDALLAAAPEEKLAAMLANLALKHADSGRVSARSRTGWLMAIAAALLIFVAGGLAGYVLPVLTQKPAQPGWRQVVAEYQGLTTTETLTAIHEDSATVSEELSAIGSKLALDISPDKLALPRAVLKRAQLFEFRGRPLVQLAYLTGAGPVAFCIIANGRPDEGVAFEMREGFNIVFWTSKGHGYMLIGKVPREALEAYAGGLAARV